MTYEEVKEKYKTQAAKYRAAKRVKQATIDALESEIAQLKAEREQYRSNNIISAERAKKWNDYSNEIERLERQLKQKKIEVVEGGSCTAEDIINKMFK